MGEPGPNQQQGEEIAAVIQGKIQTQRTTISGGKGPLGDLEEQTQLDLQFGNASEVTPWWLWEKTVNGTLGWNCFPVLPCFLCLVRSWPQRYFRWIQMSFFSTRQHWFIYTYTNIHA